MLWFTLPFSIALGSLMVDSSMGYTVTYYMLPTAESEPYDLLYDAGDNAIWFSEFAGNKIGRLQLDGLGTISETVVITEPLGARTESTIMLQAGVDLDEYEIPTAESGPTGLAIAPNGLIWFVESKTNKLGSFDPSSELFEEYNFEPRNTTGSAELEDVVVRNNNSILFTAPGDHDVIDFRPSSQTFFHTFFGNNRIPTNIVVTAKDTVWVTDKGSGEVSKYIDQTLATWLAYVIEPSNSGPTGITANAEGQLFVAGSSGGLLATIVDRGTSNQAFECQLPEASIPQGLVADAQGAVWVADAGQQKIITWRAPFFRKIWLPLSIH